MGGKGRTETIQKWSSDFEGRGRGGGIWVKKSNCESLEMEVKGI
jgi:hypothetical protein